MTNLFHLAFPVKDLDRTREFYSGVLGCREGRSTQQWIDFDLFGHQIVAHLAPESARNLSTTDVDADSVPVPHFGIVLQMNDWKKLAAKLLAKGVDFVIEPKIRFAGEIGEQATMFLLDPSGNALEFKGFNDFSQVFAK